MPRSRFALWFTLIVLALWIEHPLEAVEEPFFAAPLAGEEIEEESVAQWVNGEESAFEFPSSANQAPQWPIAISPTNAPQNMGSILFGKGDAPGPRHLRIGFRAPVPIGSMLLGGQVSVSVLKPDAPYPGDMGNEAHWLPAVRTNQTETTSAPPASRHALTLWVLPPGTKTYAVRFTHVAAPSDRDYQGVFNSFYLFRERFINIAPQALAIASSNQQGAPRLNDEIRGREWENISPSNGVRSRTIKEHPESILLVWPSPVTIRGIGLLAAGFGAASVDVYKDNKERHPREALDEDWEEISSIEGVKDRYPMGMRMDWMDLSKPVTTRAIRLRMTDGPDAKHPYIRNRLRDGKRVWLEEFLVFHPLGDEPIETVLAAETSAQAQAAIPIRFHLPEAGVVSLVIEDQQGMRVRNLVSETPMEKGDNVIWWDGTDDLGRDQDAAQQRIYRIPPRLIPPGTYSVRGLWHKGINPIYEFSVYAEGTPPWRTDNHTGAWMANHSPPKGAVFVPKEKSPTGEPVVMLGAYITEGPDGLIWVDMEGKKRGGKTWIGGTWTGAPYLSVDHGPKALSQHRVYVASVAGRGERPRPVELRITALRDGRDEPVVKEIVGEQPEGVRDEAVIGGIAVHNGVIAVSLTLANDLLFYDAASGKRLGQLSVSAPQGLFYQGDGELLVISKEQLLRYDLSGGFATKPRTVVAAGLDAPTGITLDPAGNIYISNHGKSHQVKVFSPAGKLLRAVGKAGIPKAGPYDPLRMNHPSGMAVDETGRLWVTEEDFFPKRVSLWSPQGELIRAYYGPGKYGGGGMLDPRDPQRFYYAEGQGSMQFHLDWETGSFRLTDVLFRRFPEGVPAPFRSQGPETAIYRGEARYFTNAFNSNPVMGGGIGTLFQEREGVLFPLVMMGEAQQWDVLKSEPFRARWPEGVDLNRSQRKSPAFFIWSDLNGDAHPQPEEVTIQAVAGSGVTIMPDLAFCIARYDGKTVRFAPQDFTKNGLPLYEINEPEIIVEGTHDWSSNGGRQSLVHPDGTAVVTLGVAPFESASISGIKDGKAVWSYPTPWPGQHASIRAPRPSFPGQLLGTTRLLGGYVTPKNSSVGSLWAINSNLGCAYLFTQDGLFVSTLFRNSRDGVPWRLPVAQRGANLNDAGLTLEEENFWPTLNQTPEGEIYLVDGDRMALVRLDGIDTLRPIPARPLEVTPGMLEEAQRSISQAEANRLEREGRSVLPLTPVEPPSSIEDAAARFSEQWVTIDQRRSADIQAAVGFSKDRLYAFWRTGDRRLLENSGAQPTALFKTGGALDVMIGTAPDADDTRQTPREGDVRLLVTKVDGRPSALLYRPTVPGTPVEKQIPFSSPWRTIYFDRVDDVSEHIELESNEQGDYLVSIPLEVLNLKPSPGMRIRGDIGILQGKNGETFSRLYWNNKGTGIVSDVPAEAALTPALWGIWEVPQE